MRIYVSFFQDLQYHNDDNPSKTNKMMRILMFVRILSLIRLARVSRLVRFFNEVEKVRQPRHQTVLKALVWNSVTRRHRRRHMTPMTNLT